MLSILAFPGAGLFPLAFVSLVPLLWALEGTSWKRALALGWLAGFAGNCGGFYWLVHTVQAFGNLPLPIAVASYLALCVANGLGWGVFAALTRLQRAPADPSWWFPAIAFAAVEFGWWSVFPAYFGAAVYKAPVLMQVADLFSILGCSFLLVLWNGALWQALRRWRGHPVNATRALAIGAALIVAWLGYGAMRMAQVSGAMASARQLKIGMPQSNIGAGTKRMGGPRVVATYQELSRELERRGAELIVWPETAYPYALPAGTRDARTMTGQMATPMVVGSVTLHADGREHNSAIMVDAGGAILGQSHKIYMVPFGEYLPFGDRFPKLYELIPAISHLTPGKKPEPLLNEAAGFRFASLICYEDILPGFTREAVRATKPNLIVNLTNDSWYGDSTEPTIHLALATFRAVEHRRGLVRSTNTGISALIDPLGRITTQSGQHTKEAVLGTLPLMETRPTLYTWLGDSLGWMCVAFVAGMLWRARKPLRGLPPLKK